MTNPSILLYYNKSYYAQPSWSPIPRRCKCAITNDKKLLLEVKCVVFHIPSLQAADVAELYKLHALKPPDQIWLAWSQESAANYPVLSDPRFMDLFDFEMTYRQTSDIWVPYLRSELQSELMSSRPKRKTKLCAAFISSGFNESGRRQIFDELARYVPIDSYEKFRRNRRLMFDRGPSTKTKILARYRFTLAVENSISSDYVTEKFFEPLIAGSIPIYLGAANVQEFAPGDNAYIDISDFANMQELADFLETVDERDYHEWRGKPLRPQFMKKIERTFGEPFDRVCDLVTEAAAELELAH